MPDEPKPTAAPTEGGAPPAPATPSPAPETKAAGSPVPTGASAGQPSGQPAPSGAAKEPETYEVVVGGKTERLTMDQLRELASKGHAFTQKTQQLADERRRLQAQYQAEVRKAVEAELAKARGKAEEEPPDPAAQALQATQALQQRLDDERLERTLADLKGKFPNFDEDKFLLKCRRENVSSWEDMHRIAEELDKSVLTDREALLDKLLGDEKNPKVAALRQKAIDNYLAEKQKESKTKHETGAGGSPSGAGGDKKPPTTLDEADVMAKKLLAELT